MAKSQTRIEDLSGDDDDAREKAKPASRSSAKKKPPARTTKKAEDDLRERLTDCFDRISDALAARGDDELADIFRDDAEVMSAGLVSLTRPFRVVRTVIFAFVAIIEPALAFGRIVRVLVVRFADRRQRISIEREQARVDAEREAELANAA